MRRSMFNVTSVLAGSEVGIRVRLGAGAGACAGARLGLPGAAAWFVGGTGRTSANCRRTSANNAVKDGYGKMSCVYIYICIPCIYIPSGVQRAHCEHVCYAGLCHRFANFC